MRGKMLGRTPGNLVSVHPIAAGVISDYDMTCEMLREFIRRVTSFSLFRSRVLVCVPGSITGVEERAIVNAVIEAGGRKVYLVPSAVATAVGAGLDVNRADGHMIIDIGGGTTEAAVVSLNGVVESESIKTAGAAFDEAIVKYVRRKHNLLIGIRTAEELKKSIGCVKERPEVSYEEVKGRCLMTGLPRTITLNSDEMVEALAEPTETILGPSIWCSSARRRSWWRISRKTASSCPAAAASCTALTASSPNAPALKRTSRMTRSPARLTARAVCSAVSTP